MATERFTKDQFEFALNLALNNSGLHWVCDGYKGEHGIQYHIVVKKNGMHEIKVHVASSMTANGVAEGTGDSSIRVWVMGDQKPVAEKDQLYVTRVAGWQQRLGKSIDSAVVTAQGIPFCQQCGAPMQKRTRRDGHEFWGCTNFPNCRGSMDLDAQPAPAKPVEPKMDETPHCPRCGAALRLKTGSLGKFWSCSNYPNCRFSCDWDKLPKTTSAASPTVTKTELTSNTTLVQESLARVRAARADAVAAHAEREEELIEMGLEPAKPFKPSPQQQDVFDWIQAVLGNRSSSRNLVVEARAGTGKTTTSVQSMKLLPRYADICYVAFNVHVKEDIAKKAPKWVKVMTFHGMGFSILRRAFPDCRVDEHGDKMRQLLRNTLDPEAHHELYPAVADLVSLVKANLTGTSVAELSSLADYYGIDLNGDAELIFQAVQKIIPACAAQTNFVDFDDMSWLPIYLNLPCHQYDWLYIDEAQDTNAVQTALVLRSVKPTGHVVAVGDRFQSIYGFRGADAEAIPNLIQQLGAKVLPLTVTRRCPKKVVALSNQKFPHIVFEALDDAPDGEILNVTDEAALEMYQPKDMALCRTNAPLVKPALALIRKGIKAIIRGREIGSNLLSLVEKQTKVGFTAVTPDGQLVELLSMLHEYCGHEIAKLSAANKEMQAQNMSDKEETIVALADGCRSIDDLKTRIVNIFSDKQEGVVFSSVHKAKGLEAERVFILEPGLMPHPMASKDWEKAQEINIEYVAITRTMNTLVYVS